MDAFCFDEGFETDVGHYVVLNKNKVVLDALLKKNVNFIANKNYQAKTAFDLAVESRQWEMVSAILDTQTKTHWCTNFALLIEFAVEDNKPDVIAAAARYVNRQRDGAKFFENSFSFKEGMKTFYDLAISRDDIIMLSAFLELSWGTKTDGSLVHSLDSASEIPLLLETTGKAVDLNRWDIVFLLAEKLVTVVFAASEKIRSICHFHPQLVFPLKLAESAVRQLNGAVLKAMEINKIDVLIQLIGIVSKKEEKIFLPQKAITNSDVCVDKVLTIVGPNKKLVGDFSDPNNEPSAANAAIWATLFGAQQTVKAQALVSIPVRLRKPESSDVTELTEIPSRRRESVLS